MNKVFPSITTKNSAEAKPGSIIRLVRSGTSLFALVTTQKPKEDSASFVILNSRIQNRPAVLFTDGWAPESCLCYENELEFELRMEDTYVDSRGIKWWETPGVIVSISDQLFIRAAQSDHYGFARYHLVNIRTGEVFSEQAPNGAWTFGAWKLWLRSEDMNRKIELCSFEAAK